MKTAATVSVVVPCYNQGRFLGEALNSVAAQSFTAWECIIVDDGSTDNTGAVAQSYYKQDARFKYIKTQNSGLSAARNTGIKNSTAPFIQLLDSDDLIERDKLHATIEFYLTANPGLIVYNGMRYFEHDNPSELKITGRDNFIGHIEIKESDTGDSQRDVTRARNPFVISAPIYPKNLFDTIGCFDEDLKALEDWDFHIRCIAGEFKFHYLDAPQSRTLIRMHNNSMMRDQKLLDINFHQLILKHGLRKFEEVKKENVIKKITRELVPPILVKLIKKISS